MNKAPKTGRALRILLMEARFEILRISRTPGLFVPALILPLMFFVLFGIVMAKTNGGAAGTRYLLISYSSFGMLACSLLTIGAGVAVERERGIHLLKQALPMPPGAWLGAKLLAAALICGMMTLLLMAVAATAGGVTMRAWQWAALLAENLLGVMPFAALGLYLGSRVSGSAAPGVINLIYLPMSLLSGLWIPLRFLPAPVQQLAQLLPAYHFVQLPLRLIDASDGSDPRLHLAVLAAFTAFFLALARRRLGGEQSLLPAGARGHG